MAVPHSNAAAVSLLGDKLDVVAVATAGSLSSTVFLAPSTVGDVDGRKLVGCEIDAA